MALCRNGRLHWRTTLAAYDRVGQTVHLILEALLRRFRLTPSQFQLMQCLHTESWVNIVILTRQLRMRRQSIWALIKSLEDQRHVERRWSDGRSIELRLTKAGAWRRDEVVDYLTHVESELISKSAAKELQIIEWLEHRLDDLQNNTNAPMGGFYPYRVRTLWQC